jgi:hypothetical protein
MRRLGLRSQGVRAGVVDFAVAKEVNVTKLLPVVKKQDECCGCEACTCPACVAARAKRK